MFSSIGLNLHVFQNEKDCTLLLKMFATDLYKTFTNILFSIFTLLSAASSATVLVTF